MDIKSGNEWVFPLLKKNFKKYFWNLRGFFSKSAFSFRHYLSPACFRTLISVPGGTSTLGFPATVTVPDLMGW